jgi:8-oxo-dGTP pyrophosphatase MutT (NUDIX family)
MNNLDFNKLTFLNADPTFDKIEWKGAVLFLITEEYVFLIKRSELMPSHAGQLAFFGGNRKLDEHSPIEVALREFSEESSLALNHLKVLGTLPTVWTARGQSVVPVVAEWRQSVDEFFHYVKTNGEWDQCFAMPWKILFDETRWDYSQRIVTQTNPILFFPFHSEECRTLSDVSESHLLWGATARMIWDFLRLYFNTKS